MKLEQMQFEDEKNERFRVKLVEWSAEKIVKIKDLKSETNVERKGTTRNGMERSIFLKSNTECEDELKLTQNQGCFESFLQQSECSYTQMEHLNT